MAIPSRFSNIPSNKGIIEAKILKTNENEIELPTMISNYNIYTKYITDENILKSVMTNNGSDLISLDGGFSFSPSDLKSNIENEINLFLDKDTGYVTYKVSDDDSKEILISTAAYLDDKKINNVSGDLILDVDDLNTKLTDLDNKDISYADSKIEQNDGTLILNVDDLNTKLTDLDNKDIKYTDSKIEDNDGNVLLDIDDLNTKLTDLDNKDIKYTDSKIEQNDGTLILNVDDLNTKLSDLDNKNIKFDTDIEDNDGNVIIKVSEVNSKTENILKEISYNILVNSDGLTTTGFLDNTGALSFSQNSDNANQIDVSIDTSKLAITNLPLYLTPGTNSNSDVFVTQYLNIQKDDDGNITDFSAKCINIDGTAPTEYEFNLLLKY